MSNKGFVLPVVTTDESEDPKTPPPLPERELPDLPLEQQITQLQSLPPPIVVAAPSSGDLDANDFRLERTEGIYFTPASPSTQFNVKEGVIHDISEPPRLPTRAPHLPHRRKSTSLRFPPGLDASIKMMILEREAQVGFALEEFQKCSLSSTEIIEPDLSDEMINAQMAATSFQYDSVDLKYLYKVLLKVSQVDSSMLDMVSGVIDDEESFKSITAIIDSLNKIFEPTKVGQTKEIMEQFQLDLFTIYSLLKSTSLGTDLKPSPLVVIILLFSGDKTATLVMAFIIHHFVLSIDKNSQFKFVLFRSIEETNLFKMLELAQTIEKANEDIISDQFWIDNILRWNENKSLTSIFNKLILYGPLSVITHLLPYYDCNEVINLDISRFLHEYNQLHDNDIDSDKLKELTETNEQLNLHLNDLKNRYNDMLNNFQQLNAESMRVKTLIKKGEEGNLALQKDKDELEKQIEGVVGNYEVLRVREEKNQLVESLNTNLLKEIDRLKAENLKMIK